MEVDRLEELHGMVGWLGFFPSFLLDLSVFFLCNCKITNESRKQEN